MVLTTGLLGPGQAGPVAPTVPNPLSSLPRTRDSASSSSSSCGSYSDREDHDDNEDGPGGLPAQLTLRDEVVAQPPDSSQSEWEASGEDGEGYESCVDEDQPVEPSKAVSRSIWLASVLSRILRPFKWKSSSGYQLRSRTGLQAYRRPSLPKVAASTPPQPPQPPLVPPGPPGLQTQSSTLERRTALKKREPGAASSHQSKKKRRRRRSTHSASPAAQPSSWRASSRTTRPQRERSSKQQDAAPQDADVEPSSAPTLQQIDPGAEESPGGGGPSSAASPNASSRVKLLGARGRKLWRRLSQSLARVSSQPVEAVPPDFTASPRTRSAVSLGGEPAAAAAEAEVTTPTAAIEEDDVGGRALEGRADSSRPCSVYHSRTTSQSRLSSLTLIEAAEAPEEKETERPLSLCTVNCRYDVVRRVAKRFGMKDVSEDEPWNMYWTDLSISLERCKDMKRFQKINHFPGMAEICRKDLLARNLNRMLRLFPKDYNFFPKTWCLPADLGELNAYARARRNRTYILKPDTGCQGKGIYLTRSVRDLKPHTRMICQVYIARPFLVDGFKFDMRVYTLVTSCDPLRVFVFNDGLVRFATSPYHEPNSHNSANVFMHLTNYAVNKHSRTFIVDEEAGSKRKISTLNKWLDSKNYDVADIWSRIDEVIVKTLIAALPVIRHNYHACFPAHDFTYACFELLGFDVLLDHKLKPYVLEVNHSPSFHTDAQIDREIKETLLMDTFGILNLGQYDKRKVMEEDRRRVRDRLLQSIAHKEPGSDNNIPTDSNPWKAQFDWEDNNMGNFRRVYPVANGEPDKYDAFFNQNQSSLFQETAASRAREEASRQQRDLHEVKQKEEEARRSMSLARRRDYERLRPESPGTPGTTPAQLRRSRNSRTKRIVALPVGASKKPPLKCVLSSFQPDAICESEESVRAAALQERSLLIQNKGIVQLIYQMLKENKSLCAEDLRKYAALNAERESSSHGPHGAQGAANKSNKDDDPHRLPSLLTLIQKTTGQGPWQGQAETNPPKGALDPYEALVTGLSGPCAIAPGPAGDPPSFAALHPMVPPPLPLRSPFCPKPANVSGLGVSCAEASIWVRPGLRSDLLTSSCAHSTHQLYTNAPRITRSTLGRLVSTSFKLHNLEKRHPKTQVQQQ